MQIPRHRTLEEYWVRLRTPHSFVMLAIVVLVFAVFRPVYTNTYLYHDDWTHCSGPKFRCSAFPMYPWFNIMGRPLGHLILCFVYSIFDTVASAIIARFVVVAAIAAFALLQFRHFLHVGLGAPCAGALALGLTLLPSTLVSGYWLGASFIVFALAAANIAGELCIRASSHPSSRVACGLTLAAFVAEFTAMLIYQTGAMYLWTLAAISLAVRVRNDELRAGTRTSAVFVLVGTSAMAAYLFWFRVLSGNAKILLSRDPQRGAMFASVWTNLRWFLDEVLPRASSLWIMDGRAHSTFGIAMTTAFIVISVGFAILIWRRKHSLTLLIGYPVALAGLVLAAYSPMLAADFRLAVYRSMAPVSGIVFATTLVHLSAAPTIRKWSISLQYGMACVFSLAIAYIAGNTVLRTLVVPQTIEYSYVRSAIVDAIQRPNRPGTVRVIAPGVGVDVNTDEAWYPTSGFPADLDAMVRTVARDLNWFDPKIEHISSPEEFNGDGVLIDFFQMSRSGLWKVSSHRVTNFAVIVDEVTGEDGIAARDSTTEATLHVFSIRSSDIGNGDSALRRLVVPSKLPNEVFFETGAFLPQTLTLNVDPAEKRSLGSYALVTGNHGDHGTDSVLRMPRGWNLSGSDDGKHWVVLDEQKAAVAWQPNEERRFRLTSPAHYTHFRLEVTEGGTQPILRLYGIRLYAD
jgi:hypothetical protein